MARRPKGHNLQRISRFILEANDTGQGNSVGPIGHLKLEQGQTQTLISLIRGIYVHTILVMVVNPTVVTLIIHGHDP